MSRYPTILIVVALLGLPSRALAYRPFSGTDADVAEVGDVELELGPVGYLREGTGGFLVAPTLIANWGFARDLELVIEGRELIALDDVRGQPRVQLVDTQLDVKWILHEGSLQERTGPSVAAEASVLLPETGSKTPGAELAGIVSWRWPALTLHVNGAVTFTRHQTLGVFGDLIIEGPPAWAVRPVAEGFIDWESGRASEVSGLAGAIWQLRKSLSLDGAIRMARLEEGGTATRVTEIRAGLTWSFSIG